MTLYLAAYVAAGVGFGLAAFTASRLVPATGLRSREVVAVALMLAAAWELDRWKRRAL